MLDAVIRFSLRNQLLVLGLACATMAAGVWSMFYTPIDVFPDLNRPRVVVMTEAPRALASWIAVEPMPLDPPCTSSVSPFRSLPRMKRL